MTRHSSLHTYGTPSLSQFRIWPCHGSKSLAATKQSSPGAAAALPASPPPDVVPHVLLSLEQPLKPFASINSIGSCLIDGSGQTNKQQELLIPRTQQRVQGMQLPGFISGLTGLAPDPQVALLQQEALATWQTAAVWAHTLQQQQQQQLDPAWLQHLLQPQPSTHWVQLAAVLDAAGPHLQLQHVVAMIKLLGHECGFHCHNTDSSDSSSHSVEGSGGTVTRHCDAVRNTLPLDHSFSPNLIVLNVTACSNTGETPSASQHRGIRSVVLRRTCLLPQLTTFLGHLLQQHSHSEHTSAVADSRSGSSSSCNSSSLGSPAALELLQLLCHLHRGGRLGPGRADSTSSLLSCMSLPDFDLAELASLLHCCAALGQPLRSSWLKSFTAAALNELHQVLEAVDTAVDAAASSAGVQAVLGGSSAEELQRLPGVLVKLLDGLSRYPGAHVQRAQLAQVLQCIPLQQLSAPELQQLLTAITELQLQPTKAWMDAAAAAATVLLPQCGLPDQVLLLLGLTASGYMPEQDWWLTWFEASGDRCMCISQVSTTNMDAAAVRMALPAPQPAAAPAPAPAASWGTGESGDISYGSVQPDQQQTSVNNMQAPVMGGAAQQQLTAALLCDVLELLVQLQQPLDSRQDAWLAGMLEAYHRAAFEEISAVPQLLLLAGQLLQQPPGFTTRHRELLKQMMLPLQHHMHELTAEQITQAIEVCTLFQLKLGGEWMRWHEAAVLRLGKSFPLQCLARVRDSYRELQHAPDHNMQALLGTVAWRLQRQLQRQQQQESSSQRRAMLSQKNEQRRQQRNRARAAHSVEGPGQVTTAVKQSMTTGVGSAGGRVGPDGRQQWRRRKLKLPGTLDRKF